MGAKDSTKEKLVWHRVGNSLGTDGIKTQTVLTQKKTSETRSVCLVVFLLQFVWLHAGFAKQSSTNPPPEDLTARECLAAARAERNSQNWPRAIIYYQQLEAEFSRTEKPDPQQSTHRLELLECLLKNANYSECVSLIDALQKNQPLPPHLNCELLLIRGECLYRLKKYPSARASLLTLLFKPNPDHPANRQVHDRACLIIAQSLLEEDLNKETIDHLAAYAPLDPATQSMCAAIQATAFLRLNLPDKSLETLTASANTMAACYLVASFDSLLLQTAIQFCKANRPEMALRCILRTRNPEQSTRLLHTKLNEASSQMLDAKKREDNKTLSRVTKHEATLKAEIQLASAQSALLAEAVLTTATSFASACLTREAFILLKYFTELPIAHRDRTIEPHQKMLLGCVLQMERWDDAINIATKLESQFKDPKQKLETALLKGIAMSKTTSPARAISVFEDVSTKSDNPELTTRARMLSACTQLETGDYVGAIATAKSITASDPRHQACDSAQYIIVAANIATKDALKAIAAADQYLGDKTKIEHREFVEFYRARALLWLNDPLVAINALRSYIIRNPLGEKINDARLLLGDALLSVGQTTEGIASIQSIPSHAVNAHDEGQLRIAKALLQSGQPVEAEKSLTRFVNTNPQSNRIAEACKELLNISHLNQTSGAALQSIRSLLEHKPDDCHTRSADAIVELLSNTERTGVDEANTGERIPSALGSAHNCAPCSCAIAKAWAIWRKARHTADAESDHADDWLEETVTNHPSTTPEKILFEIALHYSKTKRTQKSLATWRELLRWHPCTKYKDQALLNTGLAELELGRATAAFKQFGRLESEFPNSSVIPRMLITRAEMYRRLNEGQKRLDDLIQIAGAKSAPIAIRSRALLEIGEHKIDTSQDSDALVYLQRVTLTGRSQPEMVARAYERIGFALTRLGQPAAAETAYTELLADPELNHTSAASECRLRTSTAAPSGR